MKLVTSNEMRRIEEVAVKRGQTIPALMEAAGEAVAREVQSFLGDTKKKRVLILVGPGNNGGDGLAAARVLHDAGVKVTVYLAKRPLVAQDENAALVLERKMTVLSVEEDQGLKGLISAAREVEVVVDALLGVGLTRPVEGSLMDVITKAGLGNEREGRDGTLRRPVVVAVDIPTGVNSDTGQVMGTAVFADVTVTMAFPKVGLYLFPGAYHAGEVRVADIGISQELAKDIPTALTSEDQVWNFLPKRPLYAHKGTFGRALVIAGSLHFTGAAYLAATGAARAGAGLVTLATPRGIYPIVAAKLTETTFLPLPEADLGAVGPAAVKTVDAVLDTYKALLIGCGLGQDPSTVEFVRRFLGIDETETKPLIGFGRTGGAPEGEKRRQLPPLVIDADGLNSLVDTKWWTILARVNIITPHPGELSRLLGTTVEDIEANRLVIVRDAAKRWGQIVVLKGANTLVAHPDGRVQINPAANPGLASGGTGDVLAGVLVGLLAQGLGAFEAAVAGVYLHSLAGELVRREMGDMGILAGDLLPALPKAISLVRGVKGFGGLERSTGTPPSPWTLCLTRITKIPPLPPFRP